MERQMGQTDRDPNDIVHLKLRFRESLRAELEIKAKEDAASLNGEIVRRLKESLERDRRSFIETALLSGDYNARIVRGVSALLIFGNPDGEWDLSGSQRMAIRFCINQLLDALMPPSTDMEPEDQEEAAKCLTGLLSITNAYLRRIGAAESNS
jgi:hypothetical protein